MSEINDRESGMRIRFVKEWEITPDPEPLRCDGYMCEDGQIRFLISRDGGKTWEPNGDPLPIPKP